MYPYKTVKHLVHSLINFIFPLIRWFIRFILNSSIINSPSCGYLFNCLLNLSYVTWDVYFSFIHHSFIHLLGTFLVGRVFIYFILSFSFCCFVHTFVKPTPKVQLLFNPSLIDLFYILFLCLLIYLMIQLTLIYWLKRPLSIKYVFAHLWIF